MRLASLILLALLLGACCTPAAPPKAPSRVESAAELQTETVGLVRFALRLEMGEEEIKFTPVTRVVCSGVWISASSFVTANHCVDESEPGEELLYVVKSDLPSDGVTELFQPRMAKLIAKDPVHDLALLKALVPPPHGVAALSTGPIQAGQTTQSMGHPLGNWYSYSTGVVAAVRRAYLPTEEDDSIAKDLMWIQTTAPISGGNSGGGLFDEDGHLIGICSRSRRDGENLNFFVHRDYIRSFLASQKIAL